MRAPSITLLFASVAAFSGPMFTANAQTSELREGVRVRITNPVLHGARGVVQAVGSDSVVIYTEPHGARLPIALASVSNIEVSQGRSAAEGAKKGAMWGALVGAATSAIVLATIDMEDSYFSTASGGEIALQNFLSCVLLGGGIGAFVKAERWEKVDLKPRLRLGSRTAGLGISRTFQLRF